MTRYTLGIDIGTTGTKTVLLDVHGGLVAEASQATELHSPFPGAAEADTQQWIRNVVDTIRKVLSTSGVNPADVAAIATTGMLPAVVVVDANRRPLRRAILQNDTRAIKQVSNLQQQLSHLDLVALTGSAITQQSVAPKLAWLAEHEPDVIANTRSVLGSYDWVLVELGADLHVEQNWALESGIYALADGSVLDEVVAASGVNVASLPAVYPPSTRVGGLNAHYAAEIGLPEGTPLIIGGADHVLSAYAAGVQQDGDWLVKLGGAGDILVATDRPVVDSRLYLDAHPVPGVWLPNGCMATSGSLVRWFQTLVGGLSFEDLEKEAANRPPADLLVLPYFLGEKSPLHDPNLRGAYVGLHMGHTRADMYRATMESIAYGFRHHTEVFRDLGLRLDRVMITNGGSKSRMWKQIHADVLGQAVTPVAQHPGASLGAAIIAAIGAGERDSWDCVTDFIHLEAPIEPDPERVKRYDEAYATWRQLGEVLTPISHTLAERTHA